MPRIVTVIRSTTNSRDIRVFFDGPVVLRHLHYTAFTKGEDILPTLLWPEGATHYWYSEAGSDHDPNGFTDDELGAFLWGQWVLSMQDEWRNNNAYERR